jgi:SulP family sulfate permease
MKQRFKRILRNPVTFRPVLVDCLKNYNRATLSADLAAGVAVAFVALPLAIAFAIASGVPPVAGLSTAIVGGFIIALLGGSKLQVSGPTGAFVAVVYVILSKYGFANLLLCTFLSGAMLFAMGFFQLGNMIRFIPVSIVIGFTNGIAVFIGLQQVKDFLGLNIDKLPNEFFLKVSTLFSHLHTIDPLTVTVSMISMAILIFWPRLAKSRSPKLAKAAQLLPAPIVVLIVATVIVGALFPAIEWLFSIDSLTIATIGSVYGGIPHSLPAPTWLSLDLEKMADLVAPAITIALLGAIESLLSARVADNLTGDRHNPNQELMAQGIGNLVVPIWGGIPATGAIARTAANIRANAQTPVSAITHAITLLLIMLIAAPLASSVPLAALAAILIVTAYNMGNWREFRTLHRYSLRYRVIMLTTFSLTVLLDLTVAVQVGLILASVTFITHMSSLTHVAQIHSDELPDGVVAYALFGTLFFGAVAKIDSLLDATDKMPKVMILEMHQVISLDRTGLEAIEGVDRALKRKGGILILCGLTPQPEVLLQRSSFMQVLTEDNLLPDLDSAIARAKTLLANRLGES